MYQWYHWQQKNVQEFLVTIGKNDTNGTIGRFADFAIEKNPNVAIDQYTSLFFVCFIFYLNVLFIKLTFASMTKIVLIYEIH